MSLSRVSAARTSSGSTEAPSCVTYGQLTTMSNLPPQSRSVLTLRMRCAASQRASPDRPHYDSSYEHETNRLSSRTETR